MEKQFRTKRMRKGRVAIDAPVSCPYCRTSHVRRYPSDYACKPCRVEWLRKYRARPEIKLKSKNRELMRKYGIGIEQFNAMHERQAGLCAACGKPETDRKRNSDDPRDLAVDHCHETGTVRGLLCGKCNKALGLAGDCADTLRALAEYVEQDFAKS